MFLGEPVSVSIAADAEAPEEWIPALPPSPAVFLIWPESGAPYLGRTASLRRRLARLLGKQQRPSRWLNLRSVATRVDYWLTGSRLESALTSWELGRRHFPETYQRLLKLRLPTYVKLVLTNRFPRTLITRKLSRSRAVHFGPFRSRASAEHFEGEALDLFQVRRCPENLEPSPDHPGCIYGEMNRCLRPCQQVVSEAEYASEAGRFREFLSSNGHSLLVSIADARERLSEELHFEDAAREHARWERVEQVIRRGDELARDIDRLHGVAVTPSVAEDAVELWFLLGGRWAGVRRLSLAVVEGKPAPLDRRVRELAASVKPAKCTARERQEHLALLARWYYSSWRDGEWLAFAEPDAVPYRKLVNAIHRVAV